MNDGSSSGRLHGTVPGQARPGEQRRFRLGLAAQLVAVVLVLGVAVLFALLVTLRTAGTSMRSELLAAQEEQASKARIAAVTRATVEGDLLAARVGAELWRVDDEFGRPPFRSVVAALDGEWSGRWHRPASAGGEPPASSAWVEASALISQAVEGVQWRTSAMGAKGISLLRIDIDRTARSVVVHERDLAAAVAAARPSVETRGPSALRVVDDSAVVLWSQGDVGPQPLRARIPGTPWFIETAQDDGATRAAGVGPHPIEASLDALRTQLLTLLAVVVLLVGPFIAFLFYVRVSKPLREAEESVRLITRGNLDHKVVTRWDDEVGRLAQRINELTEQLRRSRDRLRDYNRTLERGVEERTEELARRNVELGRLYRDVETAYVKLQTTQSQMIQQERMATLGQLLAGIAHEINNPVNYLTNAVPPLQRNLEKLREVLLAIDQRRAATGTLDPAQWAEIDKLRRRLGWDTIDEDIADSIRLIQNGAERTARIVTNLRAFSRTQKGQFGDVDLAACLEVTLSLLSHLMKGRIEVVREYQESPAVEGSQGEINQVLMNILANACQAIVGEGTIRVAVRPDGEGVAVDIRDSGAGIPEAVLPRIFEPFFTTKTVEQGTGLGLSITYGIVQQHHGRIDVASVVGEGTEFTIWLPTRQPPKDPSSDGGRSRREPVTNKVPVSPA